MAPPPPLSRHFQARQPSPIRTAQILAARRPDVGELTVVNLAIGNVSLPAHPALRRRLAALAGPESPFRDGVVRYSPSAGTDEAQRAFLNVIGSQGVSTEGLHALVTDGGSLSMELMLLGVCGPCSERPLLVLDPTYSNYVDMARRIGAHTVSVPRRLGEDDRYQAPDLGALARVIAERRPSALLVIPADNPTGQHLPQSSLEALARLAVEHDLWLVSDEAYRQLTYAHAAGGPAAAGPPSAAPPTSVWRLTEAAVPGITGRRISIESASKVFNACGLRVGALVTDNEEFHRRAVAEHTANLCSNVLGQWVFGALAHESHAALHAWYAEQRAYYDGLLPGLAVALRRAVPGLRVSSPDAAIYMVLDVAPLVGADFDAAAFVRFCAERGRVELAGRPHTLLLAPMAGFQGGDPDPAARTQMRLAAVEGPGVLRLVPELLRALLLQYGIALPEESP